MKKLFLFIVAAMFAAVSFSACSDDDNGGNINPSQIVGTWGLVHVEDEDYDYDVVQGDEDWHKLVFKADGSLSIVYDANDIETGKYSIKGNRMTVEYDDLYGDEEPETDVKKIKTLNSTTLVLEGFDYSTFFLTYKRL